MNTGNLHLDMELSSRIILAVLMSELKLRKTTIEDNEIKKGEKKEMRSEQILTIGELYFRD